jgi:hypothetical protein
MTAHYELYTNESSLPAQSTLSLGLLEDIIHNRIMLKKREMHTSHSRDYNDSLWTEIETLQWVLAQILTLLQQSPATNI